MNIFGFYIPAKEPSQWERTQKFLDSQNPIYFKVALNCVSEWKISENYLQRKIDEDILEATLTLRLPTKRLVKVDTVRSRKKNKKKLKVPI